MINIFLKTVLRIKYVQYFTAFIQKKTMNMVTDTRRICSNIMDGDTNIDVPRFVMGNGICLVPLGADCSETTWERSDSSSEAENDQCSSIVC